MAASETLPWLAADDPIRCSRTAFVGYSDVTSIHTYLTCHVGVASSTARWSKVVWRPARPDTMPPRFSGACAISLSAS